MTAPLDEEIPTFPDDHSAMREQVAFTSDSDVSDYNRFTHKAFQNPPLKPTTSAEMLKEQQTDRFCRDIVARLHTGEELAFRQEKKKNVFLWYTGTNR